MKRLFREYDMWTFDGSPPGRRMLAAAASTHGDSEKVANAVRMTWFALERSGFIIDNYCDIENPDFDNNEELLAKFPRYLPAEGTATEKFRAMTETARAAAKYALGKEDGDILAKDIAQLVVGNIISGEIGIFLVHDMMADVIETQLEGKVPSEKLDLLEYILFVGGEEVLVTDVAKQLLPFAKNNEEALRVANDVMTMVEDLYI